MSSDDKGGVHVGIGGWTYEPWRDNFYPKGLAQARELEYAARQVTAIEINGTYYGTQKRDSFVKWAASVPDGFVFTVKASRFCTNRKILAESGESIAKFLGQGIAELGDKLGPILWQFMATKKFDAVDFDAFLALLPAQQEGVTLRHAIQVRHESFRCPEFAALAAQYGVAIVVADHADYPQLADVTAPFVYARLENAQADVPTGYRNEALDRWAEVVDIWRKGGVPDGLVYAGDRATPKAPRDVYLFMINGAKERAPAAARALLERVG